MGGWGGGSGLECSELVLVCLKGFEVLVDVVDADDERRKTDIQGRRLSGLIYTEGRRF